MLPKEIYSEWKNKRKNVAYQKLYSEWKERKKECHPPEIVKWMKEIIERKSPTRNFILNERNKWKLPARFCIMNERNNRKNVTCQKLYYEWKK